MIPIPTLIVRIAVERPVDVAVLLAAVYRMVEPVRGVPGTFVDPLPADAKLAWWGEELRGWAARRSRHPLGRRLEPVRADWAR